MQQPNKNPHRAPRVQQQRQKRKPTEARPLRDPRNCNNPANQKQAQIETPRVLARDRDGGARQEKHPKRSNSNP